MCMNVHVCACVCACVCVCMCMCVCACGYKLSVGVGYMISDCRLSVWVHKSNFRIGTKPVAVPSEVFTTRENNTSESIGTSS